MATEIELESRTASELEQFDEELKKVHIAGFWRQGALPAEPLVHFKPCIWKWEQVRPLLDRALEVVPLEGNEARRTLRLLGPGPEPGTLRRSTTHTIHMSVQIVNPGEIAGAHRHTMAALRFIVEGGGAYTTVEGERFPMHPGDLILTPQWTYHDHGNETNEPIIWLDGLDSALIMSALDVLFYEEYPTLQQPVTRPKGWTLARSGLAQLPGQPGTVTSPTAVYPWAQVYAQLKGLAAEDDSPFDGAVLEYRNPFTGGYMLPTIGSWLQLLRPGLVTKRHRHTSSSIFYVERGEGRTLAGDKELTWKKHDLFVVPNWTWHHHENMGSEDAILYSMNDIPVYAAFGLYREQPDA
jgi:1-hydroxy-2-naphthoate dioxygenase